MSSVHSGKPIEPVFANNTARNRCTALSTTGLELDGHRCVGERGGLLIIYT